MADPTFELTALGRDLADRMQPPGFGDVLARARRHRRRRAVVGVAACALLAGGVGTTLALGTDLLTRTAPDVADSSTNPVVDAPTAHLFSVAGLDDGSLAVVWRDCGGGGREVAEAGDGTCDFALAVRSDDRDLVQTLDGMVSPLQPVPGGWYTEEGGITDALVSPEGELTILRDSLPREVDPQPGDVAVVRASGVALYRPSTGDMHEAPAVPGMASDGYVTPDGRYVATSTRQNQIPVWTTYVDGQASSAEIETAPGVVPVSILGAGNHIAGLLLDVESGKADGVNPFAGFVLSHDGGATFTQVSADAMGIEALSSFVVTPAGTILAVARDGFMMRLPEGADEAVRVLEPEPFSGVFGAGDRVYATPYGSEKGPLAVSDDDGLTWTETPVPGLDGDVGDVGDVGNEGDVGE